MKAWLKGGLIAIGIWGTIIILSLFFTISSLIRGGVIEQFIDILTPGCPSENFGEILCPIFIYPIFYFLIGSLIGFIIQKIKEKKNENAA